MTENTAIAYKIRACGFLGGGHPGLKVISLRNCSGLLRSELAEFAATNVTEILLPLVDR